MQRKKIFLLSAILLLSLVAVFVVAICIVLNQPDKPNKTSSTGLVASTEPQIVYPAPNSVMEEQAAYPPPATMVVLPTATAFPTKVIASPTAEQGIIAIEDVQRTSLQDAKTAYENKQAIFLDVRTSESYARNHVPGAISIPEAQIIERMKELDPNQWIITYCS